MADVYEINELRKEESWRMFRIIGELVEGFDELVGINPAVTIYGSARTRPGDKVYDQAEEIAKRLGEVGFNIITGGGPGVMEAANKGAKEAGVISIGLNIQLPDEQSANNYATKTINFHHFFVRKIMLVKYASAFVIMPGGIGTLDELSEVLVLIQTAKIKPFPVLLMDSRYWAGLMRWFHKALGEGYVSEEDFHILRLCDSPDEVVQAVQQWYIRHEITGHRAFGSRMRGEGQ